MDLESHADTCVLGANTLLIQYYGHPVNVLSYDPDLEDCNYQTVNGVIGYDYPITGQTYHLVIHKAISIPHLKHQRICPIQSRVNYVTIGENPKSPASNPTNETHSIIVTDPDDPAQRVISPLAIRRVTTYFPNRPITK